MADKITRNPTYGLVTTVVGLEIQQVLTYDDPVQEASRVISTWIANTRDEGIRKALIELGWTPPAQDFIPAPRPTKADPIKAAGELKICNHTDGLTYTPGGPTTHRCNTCDLPLSIEEVRQANDRHRTKGFPYG